MADKDSKDNKQDKQGPEPIQRPAQDTGFDSAPPTAAEAGVATHINAYAQEIEEARTTVVIAVNDAFDKAAEAVRVAQARNSE